MQVRNGVPWEVEIPSSSSCDLGRIRNLETKETETGDLNRVDQANSRINSVRKLENFYWKHTDSRD